MRLPRIDPVGLIEYPSGYSAARRGHSESVRLAAAVVLGAFLIVNVATTVYSLGVYCLTTYASVPFVFAQ